MRLLRRHICVIAAVLVAGCTSVATKPGGDTPPPGWSAHNVELLGYTAMKGNSAFKITMTRAGDRWYIIGGHYNTPGWSVVDVTDPRHPFVAKFIPGPTNTSTNQVVSADGILVAALGRPNEREDAGMTAEEAILGRHHARSTSRTRSIRKSSGAGTPTSRRVAGRTATCTRAAATCISPPT